MSLYKNIDFVVENLGSVWTVRSLSQAAKSFAEENFLVEDFMGSPDNFTTDWRPALALGERLTHEGWRVAWGQM